MNPKIRQPKAIIEIVSPKNKRKKTKKRQKLDKENEKYKALKAAAEKTKDKNTNNNPNEYYERFHLGPSAEALTPSDTSSTQLDLMKMFTKEIEQQDLVKFGFSSQPLSSINITRQNEEKSHRAKKKTIKSPTREASTKKLKYDFGRFSSQNFTKGLDISPPYEKKDIKLKTKNFNQKVRKANAKNAKRKSRERKTSKNRGHSANRNSSNTSLKTKMKRRMSKPHKTTEKTN